MVAAGVRLPRRARHSLHTLRSHTMIATEDRLAAALESAVEDLRKAVAYLERAIKAEERRVS